MQLPCVQPITQSVGPDKETQCSPLVPLSLAPYPRAVLVDLTHSTALPRPPHTTVTPAAASASSSSLTPLCSLDLFSVDSKMQATSKRGSFG